MLFLQLSYFIKVRPTDRTTVLGETLRPSALLDDVVKLMSRIQFVDSVELFFSPHFFIRVLLMVDSKFYRIYRKNIIGSSRANVDLNL